jgi:protocatechuate 3,4-dioxygenase beta subunit
MLASQTALAANCVPTPSLPVQNYPGFARIQNGNNLMMPTGKSQEAEGQRVVIYGTLVDTACVPVADAQIELWQVDPFGKWMLATRADLVTPNPVFAGAGRTSTSNDGRFHFITLFPGSIKGRAPHYNVRITLRGQKPFTTALYFADDGRNAADVQFKRLNADAKRQVSMQVNEAGTAGLSAAANLVLPFKQNYRGYYMALA